VSLTAGTRLGPYEITALIGAGGMGQVYRARDTRLQRDVAIKVLPDALSHDADRLARFEREAQVLASRLRTSFDLSRTGESFRRARRTRSEYYCGDVFRRILHDVFHTSESSASILVMHHARRSPGLNRRRRHIEVGRRHG